MEFHIVVCCVSYKRYHITSYHLHESNSHQINISMSNAANRILELRNVFKIAKNDSNRGVLYGVFAFLLNLTGKKSNIDGNYLKHT